jgi:hypothetical protein
MLRQSRLSTEYVRVLVSHKVAGAVVDPTADVGQAAFMIPGQEPTEDDWETSSWESSGDQHWLCCLVGPDGVALPRGTYDVWVRIADSPTFPNKKAGALVIF